MSLGGEVTASGASTCCYLTHILFSRSQRRALWRSSLIRMGAKGDDVSCCDDHVRANQSGNKALRRLLVAHTKSTTSRGFGTRRFAFFAGTFLCVKT